MKFMDPVMVAVDETLRYIQAQQYQQFQEQYYYDYYYESFELHQAALDPDKITDWLPGERELYNTITTSIKEQLTTAADHVGKAKTDALEKTRFWEKVTPELDKVLYKHTSTMEEHIEDIYKAGKKQGFDKLQVKSFFGAADKQALFTLKNYNFDLVKNLSDDLRTQIRREVWTGVARGDTIRQVTNRIKALNLEPIQAGKRLITPEQRARLIARTETMRAVNQGQLLAFQQYGIEYIEIITSGDARVCPYCQSLDGKIYPIRTAKIPPFHPLCYDKDTEVFTNNGWKLFKDVDPDDKILSMNPETHLVEFIPYIQKIEYHHNGEMYHIHNKWFDMKITPDHDVYTERRVDHGKQGRILEPFFVKPWELHSEHLIPRTCEYNLKSPEFIHINGLQFKPKDYALFMAWYLSDGSILHDQEDAKRRAYPIKIAQQDPSGRAILKEGLKRIGESLGLRLAVGKEYFEFYSKELYEYLHPLGGSYEKYIPNELFILSREHLNIFLDNYLLSDGHERVKNNGMVPKSIEKVLFTTSPKLADDLSHIILLAGYYPSFAIHKMKGREVEFRNGTYKINRDMFRISINRTKHATMQNMTIDIVPYEDMVYCLELPKYHTLWVRRKGKTSWGGNCRCTIAAADKPTSEPIDISPNDAVNLVDQVLGSKNVLNDKALKYVNDFQKATIKNKVEYGQIFDSKTGIPGSPKFKGGKNSVNIKTGQSVKNPKTGKWEYTQFEGDAMIHNHPSNGFSVPSGDDFALVMSESRINKSVIVSQNEKWMIKAKGKSSLNTAESVRVQINQIVNNIKNDIKTEMNKGTFKGDISFESLKGTVDKRAGDEIIKIVKEWNKKGIDIEVVRF